MLEKTPTSMHVQINNPEFFTSIFDASKLTTHLFRDHDCDEFKL